MYFGVFQKTKKRLHTYILFNKEATGMYYLVAFLLLGS